MRIEPANRLVHLSVREASEFSLFRRRSAPGGGRWRTEAGRAWHEALQREMEADYRREVPCAGELRRGGWTLRLEGRCDLAGGPPGTAPALGEIKTVTDPLPLPEPELRARHPAYFRQLAAYRLLAAEEGGALPEGFLLFVEPDSGIRQSVPSAPEDLADLESRIGELTAYLDDVARRARGRETLAWRSFAESPRDDQIEAARLLGQAAARARLIGFQAPTGFGKTRIVLEEALRAVRSGQADRILYLTGKTSGQEQACAELRALFPGAPPIRSYRMRNHGEHAAVCPLDGCRPGFCAEGGGPDAGTAPVAPPDHPGFPEEAWERVVETGRGCPFCPYALSRAFLSLSDLWIADYNYLIAPQSRSVFLDQAGFDPSRIWVLVDEAHNLPDRAAGALGGTLAAEGLLRAAEDLRGRGVPRALPGVLRELAREVDRLPPERPVDTEGTYRLLDLFEAQRELAASAPLPWDEMEASALEALRAAESVGTLFAQDALDPVFWTPAAGRLEWLPLDPVPWIDECLRDFARTLFFSATLAPFPFGSPRPVFAAENPPLVRIDPPAHPGFRAAIDTRPETTRRRRGAHYGLTAATAAAFAERADSCVAAFFPSYEYAEAVETYLRAEAPHLRILLQPRDLDAGEREQFARTAPAANDVLLLMLGGTFAEAIDSFGGVIRHAMIVGPGLPELSAINRLRMESYPDREAGFHEICRVPGMRRVNQAIGRFVRSAEHSASILLHDRRFLEPEYRRLLREDLPEPEIIRTESALLAWIEGIA